MSAYGLNLLMYDLREPANRAAFAADEAVYRARYELTAEEARAVRQRDWRRLYELGANVLVMVKLGAVTGVNLYQMGAEMRGQSWEAYRRFTADQERRAMAYALVPAEPGGSASGSRPAAPVSIQNGSERASGARVVGGLGVSHAPSIGATYDRGESESDAWRPLFDAIRRGGAFLKELVPNVLIVVYNDHMDHNFLDNWPTFQIGVADQFQVADEGFGPRAVPPVPGHPRLAMHLARSVVEQGFDLSVSRRLDVDHGVLSPLPIYNDAWLPIVPIVVNVTWEPLPTPRRCWELGRALRRAIESYPEPGVRVAVVGTGGLSHQLAGPGFGTIRYEWDRERLDLIERDPLRLANLSMGELQERGGPDGAELVQWLIMRGAVPEATLDFKYYYPKQIVGHAVAAFREG